VLRNCLSSRHDNHQSCNILTDSAILYIHNWLLYYILVDPGGLVAPRDHSNDFVLQGFDLTHIRQAE
jgi:hypothetical protein